MPLNFLFFVVGRSNRSGWADLWFVVRALFCAVAFMHAFVHLVFVKTCAVAFAAFVVFVAVASLAAFVVFVTVASLAA